VELIYHITFKFAENTLLYVKTKDNHSFHSRVTEQVSVFRKTEECLQTAWWKTHGLMIWSRYEWEWDQDRLCLWSERFKLHYYDAQITHALSNFNLDLIQWLPLPSLRLLSGNCLDKNFSPYIPYWTITLVTSITAKILLSTAETINEFAEDDGDKQPRPYARRRHREVREKDGRNQ
jgi:hypothetical protein